MDKAWVYILLCSDKSYYTGSTTELEQRISQHELGEFKGYTYTRRPVKLVFSESFPTVYEAIQAERHIKGWSRKKKEALINGDYDLLHELAKCQNETHFHNNPGKKHRPEHSPTVS